MVYSTDALISSSVEYAAARAVSTPAAQSSQRVPVELQQAAASTPSEMPAVLSPLPEGEGQGGVLCNHAALGPRDTSRAGRTSDEPHTRRRRAHTSTH